MHRPLPTLAIVLSAAGILPFAILGVLAVGATPEPAVIAARGLVGYGAVILSFLGAVHWGFTLDEPGDGPGSARAVRARLVLGVLPALIGWAAILGSLIAEPVFSLAVLIAGFIGVVVIESRAHRRGLVPGGYMAMRWVVSITVIALLTTVAVLRLAGAQILL